MITDTHLQVRQASLHDKVRILDLYRTVSLEEGGIARDYSEITEDYVLNFLLKSLESGLVLVIENPEDSNQLVAEIHVHKPGLKVFDHVLGDLTVVVHSGHQGKGIGKVIFQALLDEVSRSHPDVLRIELIVRESNAKAIAFYQKLGFGQEGRFENRIRSVNGGSEADIPMAWFNPNFGGFK